MPDKKSKKMILLKLDPQLYQDLKLVSLKTSKSMTQIIKDSFADLIRKRAQKIRKTGDALTLVEHAKIHIYTGKINYPDLNSDELLYRLRNDDV